ISSAHTTVSSLIISGCSCASMLSRRGSVVTAELQPVDQAVVKRHRPRDFSFRQFLPVDKQAVRAASSHGGRFAVCGVNLELISGAYDARRKSLLCSDVRQFGSSKVVAEHRHAAVRCQRGRLVPNWRKLENMLTHFPKAVPEIPVSN